MTTKPNKNSVLLWQTGGEDSVPEPAILINPYSDVISLEQGDHSINLNFESINEFCKTLKSIPRPE